MASAEKLKCVQSAIINASYFLRDCLPITSAHMCDFITHDLWTKLLSKPIAEQLLNLSDDSIKLLPLGYSQQIIFNKESNSQHLEHATCPISSNNKGECSAQKVVPSQPVCIRGCQKQEEPFHSGPCEPVTAKEPIGSCWEKFSDLGNFVKEAHKHSLAAKRFVTTAEEILSICKERSVTCDIFHIDHGMTDKKSHEIECMTILCAQLAKSLKIKQVVDIGSGKGYLGCQMAMCHGINVLGIDSSSLFTKSATIRTTRVKKYWPGLVRNAKKKAHECGDVLTGLSDENNVGNKLNENGEKSDCERVKTTTANERSCSSESVKSPEDDAVTEKSTEDMFSDPTANDNHFKDIKSTCDLEENEAIISDQRISHASSGVGRQPSYVPVTTFVTQDTDLQVLIDENFRIGQSADDCMNSKTSQCPNSINYKDNDVDCELNVTENNKKLLLTGLHTCGDLAASVLRLFVSNTDVEAVCTVGCCYHLIEEQFVGNDTKTSSTKGFPLCQILQDERYQLGRNARMLACQSPERIIEKTKPPEISLYWRSVLQVILKDLTGEERNNWNVGRIAAKCPDFKTYVRKALVKLQIQDQLSDEDIEEYESKYSDYHHKQNAFFQLRAMLAPCIETLILLDRFCYVLEQECTKEAYLVKLFDPIKSPRCYAIVAIKG